MWAPRSVGGRAWLGTRSAGGRAITGFTPGPEGDGRGSASNTKESPGAAAAGTRPDDEAARGRLGDPSREPRGYVPPPRLRSSAAEEVSGAAPGRPRRVPLKFAGRKAPRLLPSLRIGEGGGNGGSAADTGAREGGGRKGRGRRKAGWEPPAAPASAAPCARASGLPAPQRTLLGRPRSPRAPGVAAHAPQRTPLAPGPSPRPHPRPEWGATWAPQRRRTAGPTGNPAAHLRWRGGC